MDDLRKCWKVPYIVYFCNLFAQKLDLIDLRVDEFEEAIIDDCGSERNIVIVHLLQKLLKPFINRSVDLTTYEQFLLQVLKKYNIEHLYLQNKTENQWSNLSMLTKLDIIYNLCELRILLPDIEAKLNDFEANELRIEPLGLDSDGNKLWYFGDLRLYEEKPPAKEKKTKPPATSTNTTNNELETRKKSSGQQKTATSKSSSSKKVAANAKTTKKSTNNSNKSADMNKSHNVKHSSNSSNSAHALRSTNSKGSKRSTTIVEPETKTETRSLRSRSSLSRSKVEVKEEEPKATEEEPSLSRSLRSTRRSTRQSIRNDAELNNTKTETRLKHEPEPENENNDHDHDHDDDDDDDDDDNDESKNSNDTESEQADDENDSGRESEYEDDHDQKDTNAQIKIEADQSKIGNNTQLEHENSQLNNDRTNDDPEHDDENHETFKIDVETNDVNNNNQQSTEPHSVKNENHLSPLVNGNSTNNNNNTNHNTSEDNVKKLNETYKPPEEKEEYKNELKHWRCICVTLEDWNDVNEKYKNSKKKVDQDISKLLETSYLPEMPALFQKAEKERMQRLLALAPKRQSQRLQVKQQHREHSENESKDGHFGNSIDSDYLDSNDETCLAGKHDTAEFNRLPLIEQERLKREEIARQRELRLKQRLLKRESATNLLENLSNMDENSQSSSLNTNQSSSNTNVTNDFNIKNYFLMHKVLNKLLLCKYAWPFKNAVSEDDAPDYNTIIQNPMDLSTVQLKINQKTYKSRQAFCDDLELIVHNCLTYNGDDSFYGKLAIRFENYFKRWMQIFYPREISTSLEEKNRLLLKLMHGGGLDENNENNVHTNENSLGANGVHDNAVDGETGAHTNNNANAAGNNENRLLFDFSNSNDIIFSGSASIIRKKRKTNPDKDKYIQEPQYVTKRTSSGRLVKMKISTDYDYTSDQEQNGKRKKRDDDDGTLEGIQQKHRKDMGDYPNCLDHSPNNSSRTSSSSSSDDTSEDEDFMGNKKRKVSNRRYNKTSKSFGSLTASAVRKKRTIKELTEKIFQSDDDSNNDDDSDDLAASVLRHRHDDSENDLSRFNKASSTATTPSYRKPPTLKLTVNSSSGFSTASVIAKPTDMASPLSASSSSKPSNPLTFEQYVKKLTGNCTVGQALAVADAVKSAAVSSTPPSNTGKNLNQLTPGFSLKVTPASSSSPSNTSHSSSSVKVPLSIPIINPAIKAALNKMNFQSPSSNPTPPSTEAKTVNSPVTKSIILNGNSLNHLTENKNSVKIITVNTTPKSDSADKTGLVTTSKKFLIINNSKSASNNNSTPLKTLTTGGNQPTTNLVKIINISQLNGATLKTLNSNTSQSAASNNVQNRPLIMINKQHPILTAIPINTLTSNSSSSASSSSASPSSNLTTTLPAQVSTSTSSSSSSSSSSSTSPQQQQNQQNEQSKTEVPADVIKDSPTDTNISKSE